MAILKRSGSATLVEGNPTGIPLAEGGSAFDYGWDSDLVEVPEFRYESLTEITKSQVQAGLSVVGGDLVIDTDPMLAAGANASFNTFLYFPVKWRVGVQFKMHIERIAGSDIGDNLLVRHFLYDADGNTQVPSGGNINSVGIRSRNDGWFFPFTWDNGTSMNLGGSLYNAFHWNTLQYPISEKEGLVGHETDASYAPSGGSSQRNSPREITDPEISSDWYLEGRVRISKAGNERLYRRIPLFKASGIQV